MKACLIGKKLSHSYSATIHRLMGYPYDLRELDEGGIEGFLREGDYDCVNVTIPYKKLVADCVDIISNEARAIGAVNTVVRKNGKLHGYNTDIEGMRFAFFSDGVCLRDKKVLILGSGGTGITAKYMAEADGAREVIIVGRNSADNYQNINLHYDSDIIINATPVGMYPLNGESPIHLKGFTRVEYVFDAIYNPLQTRLLQDARMLGIKNRNGLLMLTAQAVYAKALFFDEKPEKDLLSALYAQLLQMVQNVVLIGMPSSGKTMVGQQLATDMGRSFYDTDAEIEKRTGKSIAQIFAEGGEATFRREEAITLCETGKLSGVVISAGGGAVTTPEGMRSLTQNAVVVWLERDAQLADFAGRPLLKCEADYDKLKRERQPLFERYSDFTVQNNGDVQKTVAEIRKLI